MGLIRSGNTALTAYDDGLLTLCLWPIVREMVKTAIENGQNLIVEGCYSRKPDQMPSTPNSTSPIPALKSKIFGMLS